MADHGVSPTTLKLAKRYLPDMGIALPLDHDSMYRLFTNFYGQEVAYAGKAENLKQKGLEWLPTEKIACMFADAADELVDYEDDGRSLEDLSAILEEFALDPEEEFPDYYQYFDEKGNPVDFG